MDQEKIKKELVFHLMKGHAHMTFEEAVRDFPMDKINEKFPNGEYTFWHLLEHMRRTQFDILDFITNQKYEEPSWPDDYWPARDAKATEKEWNKTINSFLKDREALREIAEDPETDLEYVIPAGSGQTIMREIMVVTDHNAYHLGEFAIMKQVLGVWEKGPR